MNKNKSSRFTRKSLFFLLRGCRGFTLAEIIVSMVIIAIMALVGLSAAVLQRPLLRNIHDRYTAVLLVSSQIEDLKRAGRNYYSNAALSNGAHDQPTLADADIPDGFDLTYTVTDRFEWDEDGTQPTDAIPDYKIITATCAYGDNNEVELTAYIVE